MTRYLPLPHGSRLALVIAITMSLVGVARAGELEGLRSAVREGGENSAPARKKKKQRRDHACHDHCDCHDDDNGLDDLFGWLIGGAITSPWWGPPVMLNDDYGIEGYFHRHPYLDGAPGYMTFEPWDAESPQTMAARASIEYGTSYDGLSNVNSKFLLETMSRWGVDSAITYRSEELSGGAKDSLLTGDFNVVYRFAQSEHAQFRTGLGLNWLTGDIDDNFGLNFTYGFDLFPARPWVYSTEIDWGWLGDAGLFHLRSTAGWQFHGGELFIGVDYYDVGPLDNTTMVSGVRMWF